MLSKLRCKSQLILTCLMVHDLIAWTFEAYEMIERESKIADLAQEGRNGADQDEVTTFYDDNWLTIKIVSALGILAGLSLSIAINKWDFMADFVHSFMLIYRVISLSSDPLFRTEFMLNEGSPILMMIFYVGDRKFLFVQPVTHVIGLYLLRSFEGDEVKQEFSFRTVVFPVFLWLAITAILKIHFLSFIKSWLYDVRAEAFPPNDSLMEELKCGTVQ